MTSTRIPPDRPLPDAQAILDRVLADGATSSTRFSAPLPRLAIAASAAVIVGGVLIAPTVLRPAGGTDPVAPSASGTPSAVSTPRAVSGPSPVSLDLGRLPARQADALAASCVKSVGATDDGADQSDPSWPGAGAEIDAVLHPTLVRDPWKPDVPVWTVAVRSGGRIYGCTGRPTITASDGRLRVGHDFVALPQRSGSAGTALAGSVQPDNKPDKIVIDRWVRVSAPVAAVRQRVVLAGRPGPWFETKVVDGLAYIRSWNQAVLKRGAQARVEMVQVDAAGRAVGPVDVEDVQL